MTTSEAAQSLKNMMVDFIAEYNEISKDEALVRYEAACKESRERREKEAQDRMTMEYGP